MKRIIIILVTTSMIMSLVACGNSAETNNKEIVEVDSTVNTEVTDEKVPEEPGSNTDSRVETMTSNENVEGDNQDTELKVEADYANLPESEGFVFESNGDGTCTLVEIGTCSDTEIVIPEKSPAGDKVIKIAEYAFYDAEDVTSIIFAGRMMELDQKAFQSCEAEKIVITGCDLIIGEYAFSYCEDVSEVYISNSSIEVDTYAFYDCGKDMNVNIVNCTGVLEEKAFQSCSAGVLIINDSTLKLEENVFSYCDDLTTITFDNSTVDIGTYAFYDSGDDATVIFTNCNVEMDDKAFQSCNLTTLNISQCETVMGENTFSYCEDLTDVIISANNTEIGTYSFYDCTALVNVSIAAESEDDSLKIVIDDKALQSCAVKNVVIGDNAFSYCEDLMNVEIKGSTLEVGEYAFYDCPDELVITYNGATYNKESIEDAE